MAYTFDESILSDLHKDVYGYRPREWFWSQWNDYSDDDKQIVWDNLCRQAEDEIERQRQTEAAAVKAFDCQIMDVIVYGGALNRETAIRWIIESYNFTEFDLQYGGSYICFELGLPYSMASTFDPICKEMLNRILEDAE